MEYQIEERFRCVRAIKFMLQPLVENAVFHGLEQQAEDGLVNIHAFSGKGGILCFHISDDGCGISPERLQRLREEMQKEENSEGIGIANIYRRLSLFYGKNFSFSIDILHILRCSMHIEFCKSLVAPFHGNRNAKLSNTF